MLLSPVKPGNYRAMVTNVAITSMKIVSYEPKEEDKEVKAEKMKGREVEEGKAKEAEVKSSTDEELPKEAEEKVKDPVVSKSKRVEVEHSSSESKSKKEIVDKDSKSKLEKKLAADARVNQEDAEALERNLRRDSSDLNLNEVLKIRQKKRKGAKKRRHAVGEPW